jgi:hypothetical protein
VWAPEQVWTLWSTEKSVASTGNRTQAVQFFTKPTELPPNYIMIKSRFKNLSIESPIATVMTKYVEYSSRYIVRPNNEECCDGAAI